MRPPADVGNKLEAIGRLAAGIAHEINTPTQYVGDNTRFLADAFRGLGALLRVQDEVLDATREVLSAEDRLRVEEARAEADIDYLLEEMPRAIEQSLEGIERVTKIVQAMKEFSHPGVDAPVPTDLNRLIENTITVSTNEWKYVAEVLAYLDPSLPLVPCVPGLISQVILNLVTNAAQAIAEVDRRGEKGRIEVSSGPAEGGVEIEVRDTGPGVPEGLDEQIFDAFFTTKPAGKGTGQGLAISRSIVARHGGRIRLERRGGAGARFVVWLPLDGGGAP